MTAATRYKVIDTALCIGDSVLEGEVVVVLASEYDRDTASLHGDYTEACADAMEVARKLRKAEAERDELRAQVEAMRALLVECREFTETLQWPQMLRDKIEAALQAKP